MDLNFADEHVETRLQEGVTAVGQEIGALVKGTEYYVRVDTFNECGITHGEVVKLQGS